jgi:hypothetical protein
MNLCRLLAFGLFLIVVAPAWADEDLPAEARKLLEEHEKAGGEIVKKTEEILKKAQQAQQKAFSARSPSPGTTVMPLDDETVIQTILEQPQEEAIWLVYIHYQPEAPMSEAPSAAASGDDLAALLEEQRRCWQRGQRVPVEVLLLKLPAGAATEGQRLLPGEQQQSQGFGIGEQQLQAVAAEGDAVLPSKPPATMSVPR